MVDFNYLSLNWWVCRISGCHQQYDMILTWSHEARNHLKFLNKTIPAGVHTWDFLDIPTFNMIN